MKNYFYGVIFALLGALFTQNAVADGFVTKETLSIGDVKQKYLSGDFKLRSQGAPRTIRLREILVPTFRVLGIHQTGNSAVVYCEFKSKKGNDYFCKTQLVRFNSGSWFSTSDNYFLKK